MQEKQLIYTDFLTKLINIYFFKQKNNFLDKVQYENNSSLVDDLNYLLSESDNCKYEIGQIISSISKNNDLAVTEKIIKEIVDNLRI